MPYQNFKCWIKSKGFDVRGKQHYLGFITYTIQKMGQLYKCYH
jgi:hypothetical protein